MYSTHLNAPSATSVKLDVPVAADAIASSPEPPS